MPLGYNFDDRSTAEVREIRNETARLATAAQIELIQRLAKTLSEKAHLSAKVAPKVNPDTVAPANEVPLVEASKASWTPRYDAWQKARQDKKSERAAIKINIDAMVNDWYSRRDAKKAS